MKDSSNVTRCPAPKTSFCASRPHNSRAEQALLGGHLINNAAYQRVDRVFAAGNTSRSLHGKLFDSLSRLIERGQVVSAVTLKPTVEQGRGHEGGRRCHLPRPPGGGVVHVIDAHGVGRAVHDLYLRRQMIDLGGGRGQRRLRRRRRETALNQIEVAGKEALRHRELGQTEWRLQALPRRADEARSRTRRPTAASASSPASPPASSSSTSFWAACTGRTSSSWRPPSMGRPRRPNIAFTRPRLSRGDRRGKPRRSTARWSGSSRSKCRPSSSPRECSRSRPRSRPRRSARAS